MRMIATLSLATICAVAIAGCSGGDPTQDVSWKSVQGNLTPELDGITDRPEDIERHIAVSSNTNLRNFWDDVNRMWYLDTPSRLSPYPIANTSGKPK